MKSKLLIALLSLFICSSCLSPSDYLSVVPTTVSKGQASDYNFHFTISKAIPYSGGLFIQFPKQFSDFSLVSQCLVSLNGAEGKSVDCSYSVDLQYTTFAILEGNITAGNYIVSIPDVVNPTLFESSANFRVYTSLYDSVVEESTDFEGMAFAEVPVSLNSANLFQIPPQEMKAPTKFRWEINPNKSHPINSTIRFIVPEGFKAFRPVCEAYDNNNDNVNTLYYKKSLSNKTVDCLNIPFALEANKTYKFFIDSIYSPDHAGDFSGFGIQLINANYPATIESAVNNSILTIVPQKLSVTPTDLVLNRKQDLDLNFTVTVTHEVAHPSQLVVLFSSDWTLTNGCSVIAGLANATSSLILSCTRVGSSYIITNFALASPNTPIALKFTVKTPSVNNTYNVTFYTTLSGNKIDEKNISISVNSSSGDSDIFRFFAFPKVISFPSGGAHSMHLSFQLDNLWPTGTALVGIPQILVEIKPKIPDPFNQFFLQQKCLFYGQQSGVVCTINHSYLDRTVLIIQAPPNTNLRFIYLYITGVNVNNGKEEGLKFPFDVNQYSAVVSITPDNLGSDFQIYRSIFSNDKGKISNISLTPLIKNEGENSVLDLTFVSPLYLNNGKKYQLSIEFDRQTVYAVGLGYPNDTTQNVNCLSVNYVETKAFCQLETGNAVKNPVIHIHGIKSPKGQVLRIYIPKIAMKIGSVNSTASFHAWIQESAPGINNHLTNNFNVTEVTHGNYSESVSLNSAVAYTAAPTVSITGNSAGSSGALTFSFTSTTINPDFILYSFPEGFKVFSNSYSASTSVYFRYGSNQVLHWGSTTGSPHIESFASTSGAIQQPSVAGTYQVKVLIVKNGLVAQKFNISIVYAAGAPATSSISAVVALHHSEINVQQGGNYLFWTNLTFTAIEANKCISLIYSGNLLSSEETQTCQILGLSGDYKCSKISSTQLQITGYNALTSAANNIQILNRHKASISTTTLVSANVYNFSNCTSAVLTSASAASSPVTFNATAKHGVLNVHQLVPDFIRKGEKHPIKFSLTLTALTTFTTIYVESPSCIVKPTNYLTCYIGATAIPCNKDISGGVTLVLNQALPIGSSEFTITSQFQEGGDGLIYNCDGKIYNMRVSGNINSQQFTHLMYVRFIPSEVNSVQKLVANRKIFNLGYSDGILELNFKIGSALLAYSSNPGHRIRISIENHGGVSFQPLLLDSSLPGTQTKIPCAASGIVAESGKSINCFVTNNEGSPIIEVVNFDALALNSSVNLTIFKVKNPTVNTGWYTLSLSVYEKNSLENSENLIHFQQLEGVDSALSTGTISSFSQSYTSPLAFGSGNVRQTGDLTLVGIIPTVSSNIIEIIVVLPESLSFANGQSRIITCPSSSFSSCMQIDKQTAKYTFGTFQATAATYTLTLEGLNIFSSTLDSTSYIFTHFKNVLTQVIGSASHPFTQASSLTLVNTISAISLKPYGQAISEFNFVNQKHDIWANLEFTLTNSIKAGGAIFITADSQYSFQESCFALLGSVLDSAYGSKSLYCTVHAANQLEVSIDKDIAAGAVKIQIKLDSVADKNDITLTISTYESFLISSLNSYIVDRGSITLSKVSPTNQLLSFDLSRTFNAPTEIYAGSKLPLKALLLIPAISTSGKITISLPKTSLLGKGVGFNLPAGTYLCKATVNSALLTDCVVSFDALTQKAQVSSLNGFSSGVLDIEITQHDTSSSNLGLQFPSTAGRYQIEFNIDNGSSGLSQTRWDFLIVKPPISSLSMLNIFPNLGGGKAALKINFQHSSNIAAGKIIIKLYLTSGTFSSGNGGLNGKNINFIETSGSVTNCVYWIGSEDSNSQNYNDEFHCSINAISANSPKELILFYQNYLTVVTAGYADTIPVSFEIQDVSGSMSNFNLLPNGARVEFVAISTSTSLVNFKETGTSTQAYTNKNFDIVVKNDCGNLLIGDYVFVTIDNVFQPAATLVSAYASVTFVPQYKGLFFKMTSNVGNGNSITVGPFVNSLGYVSNLGATSLSCYLFSGDIKVEKTEVATAAPFAPAAYQGVPTLTLASTIENQLTDGVFTVPIAGYNIVQAIIDFSGVFAFSTNYCDAASGNTLAIQSCSIASNVVTIVFSATTTATSILAFQTFGGTITNPAAATVSANYKAYFFTSSSGTASLTSPSLYSVNQAISSSFTYTSAATFLSLAKIEAQNDWHIDLTSDYPNCSFLSFSIKTAIFTAPLAALEVKLPANIYSLDTSLIAGDYHGSVLCFNGPTSYPCSIVYSTGTYVDKITITGLDFSSVQTYNFKIGFYGFSLRGFSVASSAFNTMEIKQMNGITSTLATYESDFFISNPTQLNEIGVLNAHSLADLNNYFEFTIPTASITSAQSYILVLDLEAGSSAGEGFSLSGNSDFTDGSAIPCIDLSASNSKLRCIFSAGDIDPAGVGRTNSKITVSGIWSAGSANLKIGLTGVHNPPAGKSAIINFELYFANSTLIGIQKQTLFQSQASTAGTEAITATTSGKFNSKQVSYSITNTIDNFVNDQWICYEVDSNTNLDLTFSSDVVVLSSFVLGGQPFKFIWKKLVLGSPSMTYSSTDFYVSKVNAANSFLILHFAGTKVNTYTITKPTSGGALSTTLTAGQIVGKIVSSINSTATTTSRRLLSQEDNRILAGTVRVYTRITLNGAAALTNVDIANAIMKRGSIVAFAPPSPNPAIVSGDECWVDNRLFVSNDPVNPVQCNVDVTNNLIVISSFDSINYSGGDGHILIKHLPQTTAATGSSGSLTIKYYSADAGTITASNNFLEFTTLADVQGYTYDSTAAVINAASQATIDAQSPTVWKFTTTITIGAADSIDFIVFNIKELMNHPSSVTLDLGGSIIWSCPEQSPPNIFLCGHQTGGTAFAVTTSLAVNLIITFGDPVLGPLDYPVYFADIDIDFVTNPTMRVQNIPFSINSQLSSATNALASNSDIATFSHGYYQHWAELSIKLNAITKAVDSANPLVFELLGARSTKFTANKIGCFAYVNSVSITASCYYISGRAQLAGSPYKESSIIFVPASTIASGSNIQIYTIIDIPTSGIGMYSSVIVTSYISAHNLHFNGKLPYNAYQSITIATAGSTPVSPTPSGALTLTQAVTTVNQFNFVDTSPAGMASGNILVLDFGNYLTINAGQSLATDFSKFKVNGGADVSFASARVYMGASGVVAFLKFTSSAANTVNILTSQLLGVNNIGGSPVLKAFIFGSTSTKYLLASPLALTVTTNVGKLFGTISQVLGLNRLNHIQVYKYSLSSGDFDIDVVGGGFKIGVDILKFDEHDSSTTDLPCAVYIAGMSSPKFSCTFLRTGTLTPSVSISTSATGAKIPQNTALEVYVTGYFSAALTATKAALITSTTSTDRYQLFQLTNSITFATAPNYSFGTSKIMRNVGKACSSGISHLRFGFKTDQAYTAATIHVNDPAITGTPFCFLNKIDAYTDFKGWKSVSSVSSPSCAYSTNVLTVTIGALDTNQDYELLVYSLPSNSRLYKANEIVAISNSYTLNSFVIKESAAVVKSTSAKPYIPGSIAMGSTSNYILVSSEAAKAVPLVFKLPSINFSAFPTSLIEVHFPRPATCTNCWANAATLFTPNVADGGNVKCFIGTAASVPSSLSDLNISGKSPNCVYYHGRTGQPNGIVRILNVNSFASGAELTLVLYNVVATAANKFQQIEIRILSSSSVYNRVLYSNLFNSQAAATPYTTTLNLALTTPAQNIFAATGVESYVALNSAVNAIVGVNDLILIALPERLSMVSSNIKNMLYQSRGSNLVILFIDTTNKKILAKFGSSITMTSANPGFKDFSFGNAVHPINACTACADGSIAVIKGNQCIVQSTLTYPAIVQPNSGAVTFTLISNSQVAGQISLYDFIVPINSYLTGSLKAEISFAGVAQGQFVACADSLSGMSYATPSPCHAVKTTKTYLEFNSVQGPALRFKGLVQLAATMTTFDIVLKDSNDALLHVESKTLVYGVISTTAVAQGMFGETFIINYLYKVQALKTSLVTSSPSIKITINNLVALTTSSNAFVLENSAGTDVFGVIGQTLSCEYHWLTTSGVNKVTPASSCFETSGAISILAPSKAISATSYRIIVSKANGPMTLNNNLELYKLRTIQGANSYSNIIEFVQAPCEFSFASAESVNLQAIGLNFISNALKTGGIIGAHINGNKVTFIEFSFARQSFGDDLQIGVVTIPQNRKFLTKKSGSSCTEDDQLIYFKGNSGNSRNSKILYLPKSPIDTTSTNYFNFIIPFIHNPPALSSLIYTVTVFEMDALNPIPIARFRKNFHHEFTTAAASPITVSGTNTLSSNVYSSTGVTSTISFNNPTLIPTNTLVGYILYFNRPKALIENEGSLCTATISSNTIRYYSDDTYSLFVISPSSNIAAGNTNLVLNGLSLAGFANEPLGTVLMTFGVKTQVASVSFPTLSFAEKIGSGTHSLSLVDGFTTLHSQSKYAVNIQYPYPIKAGGNITIALSSSIGFINLFGVEHCSIKTGLSAAVDKVLTCFKDTTNSQLIVSGFSDISANALIAIEFYASNNLNAVPQVSIQVTNSVKDLILSNPVVIVGSLTISANQGITTQFTSFNTATFALETSRVTNFQFDYTPLTTAFQTPGPNNLKFMISSNDVSVVSAQTSFVLTNANNYLICRLLVSGVFEPVPCSHNIASPYNYISFDLSAKGAFNAGLTYTFRISTSLYNGDHGFGIVGTPGLYYGFLDSYVTATLVESTKDEILISANHKFINTFTFASKLNAVSSNGLFIVSFESAINININDNFGLLLANSDSLGNSIWAADLGISANLLFPAGSKAVPCERYFGETFISNSPVQCSIIANGPSGYSTIGFSFANAISSGTLVKLVLYGITTPSISNAPVKLSLLRKTDFAKTDGCVFAEKSLILSLGAAYTWNYVNIEKIVVASSNQVGVASIHHFALTETINANTFIVVQYPSEVLELSSTLAATTNGVSLKFSGSNVAAFIGDSAQTELDLQLSGVNAAVVTVNSSIPKVEYYGGTIKAYTLSSPIVLTANLGSISLVEFEYNTVDFVDGVVSKDRSNLVYLSVPQAFIPGVSTFIKIDGSGFSGFGSFCNATLDIPFAGRFHILPPAFVCEKTSTYVKLTPGTTFNKISDSTFPASTSFTLNIYFQVETYNVTESNLTLRVKTFVNDVNFNAQHTAVSIFKNQRPPSNCTFSLGDNVNINNHFNNLRILYKPYTTANITNIKVQLPTQLKPLNQSQLSMVCKVFEDTLLSNTSCELSDQGLLNINLPAISSKRLYINVQNSYGVGDIFVVPNVVANGFNVTLNSYNKEHVEYDITPLNPLYRSNVVGGIYKGGIFNGFSQLGIYNITPGDFGILHGAPTAAQPAYSNIIIEFIVSEGFPVDLGLSLADGSLIGCLQHNSLLPVVNVRQSIDLKCAFYNGNATANPRIIISGHDAIPEGTDYFAFSFPGLSSSTFGSANDGNTTISVIEYKEGNAGYSHWPSNILSTPQSVTSGSPASISASIVSSNGNANITFPTSVASLANGDYVIFNFNADSYRDDVVMGVYSSDACIKLFNYPVRRQIVAMAFCGASSTITIKNFTLNPAPVATFTVVANVVSSVSYAVNTFTITTSFPSPSIITNSTLFFATFESQFGGDTQKAAVFNLGSNIEFSGTATFLVTFPTADFGVMSSINPTCVPEIYANASSCIFFNNGFILFLNSPVNFNWKTIIRVKIGNLNNPNGTIALPFLLDVWYAGSSNLIFKGSFLPPAFSLDVINLCTVTPSVEFNNSAYAGAVKIGIQCAEAVRNNSIVYINIDGLPYVSPINYNCFGNGVTVKSSSCAYVAGTANHLPHIVVALQESSPASFELIFNGFDNFVADQQNVTLNISTSGYLYATSNGKGIFSTKDASPLIVSSTYTAELTVSNSNPSTKASYFFLIPHDNALENVTLAKIILSPEHFGLDLSGVSCGANLYNSSLTPFNYSKWVENPEVVSKADCVINRNEVTFLNTSQYFLKNTVLLVLHNLRNPAVSVTSNIGFQFIVSQPYGNQLKWRSTQPFIITVDDLPQSLLMNNFAADNYKVDSASVHSFDYTVFNNVSVNGSFLSNFDSNFNADSSSTCSSDSVINGLCTFSSLSPIRTFSSGLINITKGESKQLTVSSIQNPMTDVACAGRKNDLYNLQINATNSHNILYKNFKVLNPKRICHDYIDTRVAVTVTGPTTLNAGVHNRFVISIAAASAGVLEYNVSTPNSGFLISPAFFNFTNSSLTSYEFTIIPKQGLNLSSTVLTFGRNSPTDSYKKLKPLTLVVADNANLTKVQLTPVKNINFLGIVYYYKFAIEQEPISDLNISISTLQAEIVPLQSKIVLNGGTREVILGFKILSTFNQQNVIISFGLTYANSSDYSYTLSAPEMKVPVGNLSTAVLSKGNLTIETSKTKGSAYVSFNHPVSVSFLVLIRGSAQPDNSSVTAFNGYSNKVASGSFKTLQTSNDFGTTFSFSGLLADSKYILYFLADDGNTLLAGGINFITKELGLAYKITAEFSSAVPTSLVLSSIQNAAGTTEVEFQIISEYRRMLQSINPFKIDIAIIPKANTETDAKSVGDLLNSEAKKLEIGAVFPQFWVEQDLSVSSLPYTLSNITMEPSIYNFTYYNVSTISTLSGVGGLYAIGVKRVNNSQPLYSDSPSGIAILNKIDQSGNNVGEYASGSCDADSEGNCKINFDDLKSDGVYDFYFVPYANVVYTPPPVGSSGTVVTLNYTVPANPFVEKQ